MTCDGQVQSTMAEDMASTTPQEAGADSKAAATIHTAPQRPMPQSTDSESTLLRERLSTLTGNGLLKQCHSSMQGAQLPGAGARTLLFWGNTTLVLPWPSPACRCAFAGPLTGFACAWHVSIIPMTYSKVTPVASCRRTTTLAAP